jgi:heme exporter protein D
MNWHSVAEFTEMGGYGLYVWGSYLMAAATLAWELVMLTQRHRRAEDEIREDALMTRADSQDGEHRSRARTTAIRT